MCLKTDNQVGEVVSRGEWGGGGRGGGIAMGRGRGGGTASFRLPQPSLRGEVRIRDFPNHATFREKGAKLACTDKLGFFLSLTLCNKANFDTNHLMMILVHYIF